MASFAVVIRGSAILGQSAWNALRFCETATELGHAILRVFFHSNGVDIANVNRIMPQDEIDLLSRWQQLHAKTNLDIIVCVSSALKHGILDESEALRRHKLATLAPFIEIGGLGQLIEATTMADKVVSFHD